MESCQFNNECLSCAGAQGSARRATKRTGLAALSVNPENHVACSFSREARKRTYEHFTIRKKSWAIVLHQNLYVCVTFSQLKWPRDCTKAQPLHQGRLLWAMQTEQRQETARHVSHRHFDPGATTIQHTHLVHAMQACL